MPGSRHLMLVAALAAPLVALAADRGIADPAANADANANAIVAEWAAVDQAISQAQGKLAAAQQALQQGRTPLPGERRGNVNGSSRLTPAYFDRVAALEQKVAEAREQLNQAYALRRELPEDRNYQGPVPTPKVRAPAAQAPR